MLLQTHLNFIFEEKQYQKVVKTFNTAIKTFETFCLTCVNSFLSK